MWNFKEVDFFELQEFLAAKFTHDLAGIMGALDNSVEFLESKNSEIHNKAHNLIKQGTSQLISRLKFFRQCYGNVSLVGEADILSLIDIANNFYQGSKIELIWKLGNAELSHSMISPREGKLMLNILYICGTCLIKSGKITISCKERDNKSYIKISGTSELIKIENYIKKLLLERTKEDLVIDTKTIHHYYSSLLAQDLDSQIKIEEHKSSIDFIICY